MSLLCEKCGGSGVDCSCDCNEDSDSECESDRKCDMEVTVKEKIEQPKLRTDKCDQPSVTKGKTSSGVGDQDKLMSTQESQAEIDDEVLYTDEDISKVNDCKDGENELSEAKRVTRRSRLVKRPADETVWSIVEGRKEKRERRVSDERKKDGCTVNERRENDGKKNEVKSKNKK
ncbi:uncharacterized G-patch domain protein DDB_G0278987-like [Gigantopelta aegis]|uniref:uncharacterized G-patch domain protein DDB_G0278987-like n=1 Tax=Gigantopelta aegis TaxID=1735272 RepID=UPI001B88CC2D|nr:uncharacterized G-patch domain protein DDB_G0278987-like [Gigantopelta aegis]